jgi:quercetin dioxygenase-like cupin family protein
VQTVEIGAARPQRARRVLPSAAMTPVARLSRWDEIALEKITEMVSRKIIPGQRMMLAHVYLKRGALVPIHQHESEQMTYVLQGALRVDVAGVEFIVREGEVLHVPPGAPHQAEALDDTLELDVFSPGRVEWQSRTTE